MKDFPIISMSDNQDERADGVILLEESDYDKTTARLVGGIWYLVDWDIYNLDGVLHWFDRSGYSISDEIIKKLARASEVKL